MTYTEAYNTLDAVAANFRGTRTDHQTLVQALSLIKQLVEEKEPPQA